MNIGSKSQLAKLLATEDISVEHANVETAYFDLKARKVVLPNWKDMPPELYDLLLGHEIGHALVTPLEGWHDATCSEGPAFKSFLNVVEDARNERLVKQRYPGLVKSFYKGYSILHKKDFFGIGDRDVNTLPLIDRINLHYKVGSFANVSFTAEEQIWLNAIDAAEEWDEVEQIARDLFALAKQDMQDQPQSQTMPEQSDDVEEDDDASSAPSPSPLDDDAEDGEEQDGDTGSDGESDDGEESDEDVDGETGDISSDDTEEEKDSDSETESKEESGDIDLGSEINEPVASTDMAFRENEERLVENSTNECVVTAKIPKLNRARNVMTTDQTWSEPFVISKDRWSNDHLSPSEQKQFVKKLNEEFQNKNKSSINQLVMQFEMKRKASELRKAQVNNTGKLNEDKLWAYKLTDDLFLSNTVVPKGQNHGMFMVLDMSGSMGNHMEGTIEQLLIQVSFCQKVGIPFDVYGFTSCMGTPDSLGPKQSMNNGELVVENGVGLVQLITSDKGSAEFTRCFENLLMYASSYGTFCSRNDRETWKDCYVEYYNLPSWLQLGGTPLAQSMVIAIDVAKEFKSRNKVEVLNTIVLSDGENTDSFNVVDINVDGNVTFNRFRTTPNKLVLKDGYTSVVVTEPDSSFYRGWGSISRGISLKGVMELFKSVTESRMIHLFLCGKSKREVKNNWHDMTGTRDHWIPNPEFEKTYKEFWNKKDFLPVDSVWGFDAAFLIKGDSLKVEETELEVKSDKKADVLRGFRQFQSKKTNSRHFINRFIDQVA